jgi:hypothetical protein
MLHIFPSYNMVELIIIHAGDYWIKTVCVRHVDVAECWKLEGKFKDVQHRHNVHTNVCEDRLPNPNLSLMTPICPPRQRGDLKRLLIIVWSRKVSKKRNCVSGPYKDMCTVKQPSSKTKNCPQFAVWNFSARHFSRTRVLIWRYVRSFQCPLSWFFWWLRLLFYWCCLQSFSM